MRPRADVRSSWTRASRIPTVRRFVVLGVTIVAAVTAAVFVALRREPPAPDPGVPRVLAEERAARVSSLKYDVNFSIPPERDQPIRGRVSASFALADAARPLA